MSAAQVCVQLELTEEEAEALKELCSAANWDAGKGALIEGIFDALCEAGVDNEDWSNEPDDNGEIIVFGPGWDEE